MSLRAVVFDVDGTLVDSQMHIVAAMEVAFGACAMPAPSRLEVLTIVGLSLPVAMARLAPGADVAALVAAYRAAFAERRVGTDGVPPLYPGAEAVLTRLAAREDVLLAVATGKSRRGLLHLLEAHQLMDRFVALETADDHPSKPHPAMLAAAIAATGADPRSAIMVGDTTFDVEMAAAAGAVPIGVRWGYHPADALTQAGAQALLEDFAELDALVEALP